MEHHEMVTLIRAGIKHPGGIWADLGAGTGNFTWALAELLGAGATIYAIDRDAKAIHAQHTRQQSDPPLATIIPRQADVTRPIDLPALDGIIMANLLHFIRDQEGFLNKIHTCLKPGGRLLLVEYEQPFPIPWVPFPVPYTRFSELAELAGFATPKQVGLRHSPSSGRALYAAVADC